jgi:thiol-disulfide isomerase/thioredoxin
MPDRNILWVVVGVLTLGLVAAYKVKGDKIAQTPTSQQQPAAQRPLDDGPKPGPVPPPGGTAASYREAMERANKENKPVLLFFTAKACAPCQKMKAELAPSLPSVMNQIVYYEVECDTSADLVKKYNVTLTPTYLVVTGQEVVLKRGEGYRDVKAFGDWLAAPYSKQQPTRPVPPTQPNTPPAQPRPKDNRPQPERRVPPGVTPPGQPNGG